MKLYYSKGACSLAVRILINELNLPCEFEAVDLKSKKTETGIDFLTINPKGNVPTLLTDNGKILTENAVIQQYLTDIAKSAEFLPAAGDFNRYQILEWLNFISTDVHKGFTPLFNPQVPQEIKDSIFIPTLKKKFEYVDRALENSTYLFGEKFTLPDAYLFVVTSWLPNMKIDMQEWPNLTRHFTAMKSRPAVQQSLKEEKIV